MLRWIIVARELQVNFEWVRGHAGNSGNEEADALFNEGAAMNLPLGVAAAVPAELDTCFKRCGFLNPNRTECTAAVVDKPLVAWFKHVFGHLRELIDPRLALPADTAIASSAVPEHVWLSR
ncbi:hypothetical protein H9P43_002605 [Blastocladiella emersonii ATCC 22665]|nr:hypothetical protein H9P43_002605 [Blastocladiella emersonii ATCC 22665]